MHVLIVAVCLTIGPSLDPIMGDELGVDERDILPAARHVGDVMDMWMPHVVNLAAGGAGIDLFDPISLSAHGFGTSQLTFAWGEVDITDPARPGEPLLNMPHGAWERLQFHSLWSPRPELVWQTTPDAAPATQSATNSPWRASVTGAWSGEVGGGLWLPEHFMDREPAFQSGAPTARRALHNARELSAQMAAPLGICALSLFYERVEHDHHYLTQSMPDLATRNTLLASLRVGQLAWPTDVRLAFQDVSRDHDGAQYRWPAAMTRTSYGQTWLLQGQTRGTFPNGRLQLAFGFGMRRDDSQLHERRPWPTDVLDEWLWMARPSLPQRLERWQTHARARLEIGPRAAPFAVALRFNIAHVKRQQDVLVEPFGMTYRGAASSQTSFTEQGQESVLLQSARLMGDWRAPWRAVTLDVHLGLDLSSVLVHDAAGLVQTGPAAGVAVRWPTRGGELFGLLRQEPEGLTAQLAHYLDPHTPQSKRSRWTDLNGDGVAQADEAGQLVVYGGGPWHKVAANLARPSSHQLAVGYRTPWMGPWQFVLSTVGRWSRRRFVVDRTSQQGQTAVAFHDPGGDGRGESQAFGGGQNFAVYADDIEQTAQLGYRLGNAAKLAYYLGIETAITSAPNKLWFLNIGGAAYLSAGSAPFGNFVDRNDPAVIDEASSGLNNRINAFSRFEHDRAFALNILAGIKPVAGLSLAIAARYRDGEPMARIVVADNLPQGPVPLMAIRRGRARDTFHMNWDARLRYQMPWRAPWVARVVVDCFNVFGSATELLEDVRTGPSYRQSVEAIPNRALFVSLELGWAPR